MKTCSTKRKFFLTIFFIFFLSASHVPLPVSMIIILASAYLQEGPETMISTSRLKGDLLRVKRSYICINSKEKPL
jgi:hypothetical protein